MKLIRESNNAWIINKHINDVNLLILYAKILKKNNSLNQNDVEDFTNYLKNIGQYNPRWSDRQINITTAMNKVSELCFYMFGYKQNNSFIFSPLGNLFLEQELESKNQMYIFTTMLWGLQFNHPHNSTNHLFSIYPIRLVFKLLTEKELDFKLYTTEVLFFIYFVRTINESKYEDLVKEIKRFRSLSKEKKLKLMMESHVGRLANIDSLGYKKATETFWANKTHEWDYYFRKVLEQIGIISSHNNDDLISVLHQGASETRRYLYNNFITLNTKLKEYILHLESLYSFTDVPIQKDGILESDFKAEVYGFFPKILFNYIDVKIEDYKEILVVNQIIDKSLNQVREDINSLSVQGEKHAEFEFALRDGFKTFNDIKAERVGGRGKTDVECLYIQINKSFAVEAKATKNSFGKLQTGRLKEHREGINGMYTILITPKYQPVVERDIVGEEIVILKPAIFSEYIYNNLYQYKSISFEELHKIILNNLGKDISRKISELTFKRFSISA